MARLSPLSPSVVVATVVADFTEEEGASTVVEEDFMEAGSGAEGFMAGAGSAAAGSGAVVSAVEVVSAAELHFVAEAGFAGDSALAEELSAAVFVEAFVAIASGAVSVSADVAGVGEAGAGVGA